MTITSKYAGTCRVCRTAIAAGESIEWERGKGAAHVACIAPSEAAEVFMPEPAVRCWAGTKQPMEEYRHGVYSCWRTSAQGLNGWRDTRVMYRTLEDAEAAAAEVPRSGLIALSIDYADGIEDWHQSGAFRTLKVIVKRSRR